MPLNLTSASGANWSVAVGDPTPLNVSSGSLSSRSTLVMSHTFAAQPGRHIDTTFSTHHQQLASAYGQGQSDSPVMLHVPYVDRAHAVVSPTSSTSTSSSFFQSGASRRYSPPLDTGSSGLRYSPYPSPLSSTTSRFSATSAHSSGGADSSISISPTSSRPLGETIKLPPIQPPNRRTNGDGAGGAFHLPPISSMDNLREAQCGEPMAVLRRLQSSDGDDLVHAENRATSTQRRHSLAVPDAMHAYKPSDFGARSTTGGSRTPLSAVAASSSSYLPSRHEQHQQHYPHATPSYTHAQPLFDRRPSHDDRPVRSVPPSPYLGASRLDLDHRDRTGDRAVLGRERPFRLQDRDRVGVFYRQERPPSPPPSVSSHSPSASASVSASSSPSDSARPGWRPW
ncbi:hypothetical protein K466DRAFT_59005 [Polyporus arcularius HHB13444]|uniref:Uncharacterized protein n=1 Tax=Polyporus arcularius HHB13444 TaxID=1314778 RepID=A0A5C3PW73_9APHY|nr:hypothetical protein K466DRAFT_59005 [Polyporus arcularius HHB13444]